MKSSNISTILKTIIVPSQMGAGTGHIGWRYHMTPTKSFREFLGIFELVPPNTHRWYIGEVQPSFLIHTQFSLFACIISNSHPNIYVYKRAFSLVKYFRWCSPLVIIIIYSSAFLEFLWIFELVSLPTHTDDALEKSNLPFLFTRSLVCLRV